jgi:hypothetical protein
VAIVFKDLQRLVSQQQKENTSKKLFQRLQGKPFWIWDKHQHKEKLSRQMEIAVLITLLVYLQKKERKKQCLITKKYCTIAF